MRYSNVRLILNSDLMGDQWLAIRRKARLLFPGVALEEREGIASDRLILSAHSNGEREIEESDEPLPREPVPGIARFEELLRSGFELGNPAFEQPERWSAGQEISPAGLPGDVASELLC
jgi:hypothetical protein